jgi:hypothetical protein
MVEMEATIPFHIHISENAEIQVSDNACDWRPVTLDELAAELARLKEQPGSFVAYSRDPSTRSAPEQISAIFKTIMGANLPIRIVKSKGAIETLDDNLPSEPDGEASYANCLLVTLAKMRHPSIAIQEGRPVPNLATLTEDPQELFWIGKLPFKYDQLDTKLVTKILLRHAEFRLSSLLSRTWFLRARLALSAHESRFVCFRLSKTKTADGIRQLYVELCDA